MLTFCRAFRRLRRRVDCTPCGGFTLIELMIVILILAILVGVAVAVAVAARRTAWENAAKYNNRVGCNSVDNVWAYFGGLTPTGSPPRYDRYYDGRAQWADSMSRYERKMKWVYVDRPAANRLRNRGTYVRGAVQAGSNVAAAYYDWSFVYGRIGVYRGYRNTSTNQWVNSSTTATDPMAYAEVTVIICTQGSNKALWTSYRFGAVIASGTCTWSPGTGNTTAFGS